MHALADEAVVAEVLAVIGDEHHDGRLSHAGGRKMVEDTPDVVVEAGGHAVVGGAHRTPGRRAHPRVVQRRGPDDAVDAGPCGGTSHSATSSASP